MTTVTNKCFQRYSVVTYLTSDFYWNYNFCKPKNCICLFIFYLLLTLVKEVYITDRVTFHILLLFLHCSHCRCANVLHVMWLTNSGAPQFWHLVFKNQGGKTEKHGWFIEWTKTSPTCDIVRGWVGWLPLCGIKSHFEALSPRRQCADPRPVIYSL